MTPSRFRKTLIYVLGTLQELALKGLVEKTGHADALTAKGTIEFRRILASGFKPSQREMELAVMIYKAPEKKARQKAKGKKVKS